MNELKAVILAGGSGSRLWPLSRQSLPKQFLNVTGGASMLNTTVTRLGGMVQGDDIWVVTGEQHASGEGFSELNGMNLILEPCGRNTAPAIAVAAALLQYLGDDDPIMVVLPADHLVTKPEAFQHCLQIAAETADSGRLATFGIVPTGPETGFGYIQAGVGDGLVQPVIRFVEKPDLESARKMCEEGGYYWNSGMFVWKCSVILAEIEKHLPDVFAVLENMRQLWKEGNDWAEVIRHHFDQMPDVSIDYGVMEKSDLVSLVPADIGWSDVGSWDAVHDIARHDDDGNEISGNVLALDCKNSLFRSEDRFIAAVGMEDIIAVETADAILICKRDESQRVKDIVNILKEGGHGSFHLEHRTVRRPWGSYTVLEDKGDGYKLKRIDVFPGARLSLQAHQHRSEHWIVVSGTATVVCGDMCKTIAKNGSAYIPIGETHRLENRGKVTLQLIEVQVGDYLGEDDIERFDDVYGRVQK